VPKLYLFVACAAFAASPKPIVKQMNVPVAMRDGVRLFANVFLPSDHGTFPTILVRTPYGKGFDIVPNYQAFVDRGYAVVTEDVRGRYESEGAFQPLTQEPRDGDDTIDWGCRSGEGDRGKCHSVRLSEVLRSLEAGQELVEIEDDEATVKVWVE